MNSGSLAGESDEHFPPTNDARKRGVSLIPLLPVSVRIHQHTSRPQENSLIHAKCKSVGYYLPIPFGHNMNAHELISIPIFFVLIFFFFKLMLVIYRKTNPLTEFESPYPQERRAIFREFLSGVQVGNLILGGRLISYSFSSEQITIRVRLLFGIYKIYYIIPKSNFMFDQEIMQLFLRIKNGNLVRWKADKEFTEQILEKPSV